MLRCGATAQVAPLDRVEYPTFEHRSTRGKEKRSAEAAGASGGDAGRQKRREVAPGEAAAAEGDAAAPAEAEAAAEGEAKAAAAEGGEAEMAPAEPAEPAGLAEPAEDFIAVEPAAEAEGAAAGEQPAEEAAAGEGSKGGSGGQGKGGAKGGPGAGPHTEMPVWGIRGGGGRNRKGGKWAGVSALRRGSSSGRLCLPQHSCSARLAGMPHAFLAQPRPPPAPCAVPCCAVLHRAPECPRSSLPYLALPPPRAAQPQKTPANHADSNRSCAGVP